MGNLDALIIVLCVIVVQADEAYRIGPAISEHSYLDQDKLLEVAQACGAQVSYPLSLCALLIYYQLL